MRTNAARPTTGEAAGVGRRGLVDVRGGRGGESCMGKWFRLLAVCWPLLRPAASQAAASQEALYADLRRQ